MEFTINERKALHKLCFSDSDVYTDAFFKNFYKGGNAVDLARDEKLAATLYTKTRALLVYGRAVPFDFVTGLCVRPEYRRRGLATELIRKFLNGSEAPFAVLHPFDVEFYLKRGFVPFNYAHTDTCKGTGGKLTAERVRREERIRIYLHKAMERQLKRPPLHPFIAVKLSERLSEVMTEIEDGAEFLILNTKDEKFRGYALVENQEVVDYALEDGFHLNDADALKNFKVTRPELLDGEVFNMARAINVEALLYAIPYAVKKKTAIDFTVTDSLVPKNSGAYRVVAEDGTAQGVIRRTRNYGLPELTAEELTLLALGQSRRMTGAAAALKPYFFDYAIRDFSRY